jgi:hypothetical protein
MTVDLPKFKAELTGDEVLPEHLLKGKRAYLQWATMGGTLQAESVFCYEDLSDLDRQRWVFFAKAYGDPTHDHSFAVKTPTDVANYPELVGSRPIDLFDYDNLLHPTDSTDAFYELWVQQQQAKLRQHWWQFSRPTEVDTSRQRYEQQLTDYRKVATAAPYFALKKGDTIADHINAQDDARRMKEQQ